MFYEKRADTDGYLGFDLRIPSGKFEGDPMPHFHNSIEFYLCLKGEYLVYINGEKRVLRGGEIAFVDKFTLHSACSAETAEDTEVYFVIASNTYLSGIKWLTDETLPCFTERKEGFDRIIDLVTLAYDIRNEMDDDMKRGFIALLLGMMRNHCGSIPRVTEKGAKLIVEVMKYIGENLHERITLETLSAKYGYEKTYFSRMFNKFLGMNLREYLNRCRLTESERLKRENPEMPVYKIAETCGFDSANTYYRALKKFGSQKHNF